MCLKFEEIEFYKKKPRFCRLLSASVFNARKPADLYTGQKWLSIDLKCNNIINKSYEAMQ